MEIRKEKQNESLEKPMRNLSRRIHNYGVGRIISLRQSSFGVAMARMKLVSVASTFMKEWKLPSSVSNCSMSISSFAIVPIAIHPRKLSCGP